MQVSFNISDLTKEQREHVAGFIVTWPIASSIPHGAGAGSTAHLPVLPSTVAELQDFHLEQLRTDHPGLVVEPVSNVAPMHPAGTATVDKSGLLWDVRIHSQNKSFNADGTWRSKRGVDETVVASVEAELRSLMAIPSPVQPRLQGNHISLSDTPNPDPNVTFALDPMPATISSTVATMIVPSPPGAVALVEAPTVTVAIPPPPAATVAIDPSKNYVALVNRTSAALQAGRFSVADLTAICVKHGLKDFGQLGNRKDLCPLIETDLAAYPGF